MTVNVQATTLTFVQKVDRVCLFSDHLSRGHRIARLPSAPPCLREGVKKPCAIGPYLDGWVLPVFRSPDQRITRSPDCSPCLGVSVVGFVWLRPLAPDVKWREFTGST